MPHDGPGGASASAETDHDAGEDDSGEVGGGVHGDSSADVCVRVGGRGVAAGKEPMDTT